METEYISLKHSSILGILKMAFLMVKVKLYILLAFNI